MIQFHLLYQIKLPHVERITVQSILDQGLVEDLGCVFKEMGAFQLGDSNFQLRGGCCVITVELLQNTSNFSHHQLTTILPPEMEHTQGHSWINIAQVWRSSLVN
jgi:hypothetical protein